MNKYTGGTVILKTSNIPVVLFILVCDKKKTQNYYLFVSNTYILKKLSRSCSSVLSLITF